MSLTYGSRLQVPEARRKSSMFLTLPAITTDLSSKTVTEDPTETDSPTAIRITVPNKEVEASVTYTVSSDNYPEEHVDDEKYGTPIMNRRASIGSIHSSVCDDKFTDIQLVVPTLTIPPKHPLEIASDTSDDELHVALSAPDSSSEQLHIHAETHQHALV